MIPDKPGRRGLPAMPSRKGRLAAGGVATISTVSLALIVSFAYQEATGKAMSGPLSLVLAGGLGSLGATIAICAYDIRSILLEIMMAKGWIKSRRNLDGD